MPEQDGDRNIALLEAVQKQVRKIQTSALDLSFNELLDMYEHNELIIDPAYQRAFRWSEGKESRFIESLILGMPIPPLFVIELEDGKYELIDGLQRLSSYIHFRGELTLETFDRHIVKGEGLILEECDIVKELNGLTHETLPPAMQIRLKRHFIRVEVIGKDSDQRLRYHMFKRLNTGGENLSDQEIRNSSVRLLEGGAEFMRFLSELSHNGDFVLCTENLTDEARQQRADEELVLRFFAFKNNREAYKHDVGEFMTDYMESVADPMSGLIFDYANERVLFGVTFRILAQSLEGRAFGWVNQAGTIVRGFSVYHFEALTLGLQEFIPAINPDDEMQRALLRTTLEEIKRDPGFQRITAGGGRNSRGALERRVAFVRDALARVL